MGDWRSFRSQLRSHLQSHHGGAGVGIHPPLHNNQLERLHDDLHLDEYMCPPHTHKGSEDPYELGRVKLANGKSYVDDLISIARKVSSGEDT